VNRSATPQRISNPVPGRADKRIERAAGVTESQLHDDIPLCARNSVAASFGPPASSAVSSTTANPASAAWASSFSMVVRPEPVNRCWSRSVYLA
jgi:hypothetical protein